MILITGATGFIGSVIACRLNRKGVSSLILCDSFGNKEKWKNILGLNFVEFVDKNSLFEFLEKNPLSKQITTVIHLGACADTTEGNVDFLMDNNVRFSINLCRFALDNGADFIYASSGSVYGDGSLGFSDDDSLTLRLRPLNAYGFSKWLFDKWVIENKLVNSVTGLRFFNVFGPNEYHKGAMASVIFRSYPTVRKDGFINLFESHKDGYAHGHQERDFVYIDEAADAVEFILDKKNIKGIFNIGTGCAHTFNDLGRAMLKALNHNPENIYYFPMPESLRERYQYHTQADMRKFCSFGYKMPEDKFDFYVQRYVREYLAHPCVKYYSQV